jgi:hypothetical protein
MDRQKQFRAVVDVVLKICGVELLSRHAFSRVRMEYVRRAKIVG